MAQSFRGSFSCQSGHRPLSLLKFSFVKTPRMYAKLVWNHIAGHGDLLAVFDDQVFTDSQSSVHNRKVLKVFQADRLIDVYQEDIYLDEVVRQVQADEAGHLTQSMNDTDRVVLVLVKKPFLAMRYQQSDQQFCRIQMNFASDDYYQAAFAILLGLGLPIREKTVPPSVPPAATASSQPTIQHPTAATLSPSQHLLYAREQASQLAQRHPIPAPAASTGATSSQGIQDNSQVFSQHSQGAERRNLQHIPPITIAPRPASPTGTSSLATLAGSGNVVLNVDAGQQARGYTSPAHLETAAAGEDPVRRTLFPANLARSRPASAPVGLEIFSQMLPPQRALPFPKPKLQKSVKPPKEIVDRTSRVNGKKQAMSALPFTKKSAISSSEPAAPVYVSTGMQTDPSFEPATGPEGGGNTLNLDPPPPPPMHALPPPSAEEWVAAVADYLGRNAPAGESVTMPPTQAKTACSCQKAKAGMAHAGLAAKANATDSDFSMYANAPEPERRAALDAVIRELIFDPEFEVLCKDMEASVQRIGLEV